MKMSHLLSLLFYFKFISSSHVSPSNQVHIPIVFGTPVVSSVPKDSSHPPPLQVYSHHPTFHGPSDDSLLVLALPPPPALTIEPNIPIVIRKGICPTHTPSRNYTELSYQRLSQPFYTCLSSISSVSIPKIVGDVLEPILVGIKQCLMK